MSTKTATRKRPGGRTAASHRRRAALGASVMAEWRGAPVKPLSPEVVTALAEAGMLDKLWDLDLTKTGVRNLWLAMFASQETAQFIELIDRPDEMAKAIASYGAGWTWADVASVKRWLEEQASQIAASMIEVEDDEPGKP